MGGGYHVHPDALHGYAGRAGQRSAQLGRTATAIGGGALPGHALGAMGGSVTSKVTSVVGRAGGAVGQSAQAFDNAGSRLRDTAQRYTEADQNAADRFRSIVAPEHQSPTLRTGGASSDVAKVDNTTITNEQQRGWLDGTKRYLQGIGQQPFPAMKPNGDMVQLKPADLAPPKPMIDANGNVIGVSYHHGADLHTSLDWASKDRLHNKTYYLDPGQHNMAAAGQSGALTEGAHPWLQHQNGTFFLDTHANNDAFALSTHDGQRVWVHGSIFAHVVSNSAPFQQAMANGQPGSFTLLACHSGQGSGGSPAPAASFQEAMSQHFGYHQPVYAPTKVTSTGVATAQLQSGAQVPIGLVSISDGGTWNSFP